MGRGLLAFLFSLTITGVIGLDVTPALLFGVYALADGLLLLWIVRRTVALVRSRSVFRTAAILSIGAGIAGILMNAVMTPFVPHVALFSLLGTWAFLTGITEITAGWPLRRENAGEVLILMVALGGLARLLYGVPTMASSTVYQDPLLAIAFGSWAGQQSTILFAAGLAYGLFMLGLAAALRSWPHGSNSPWEKRRPRR